MDFEGEHITVCTGSSVSHTHSVRENKHCDLIYQFEISSAA